MKFNQYLLIESAVEGVAVTAAANLKANRGFSNFESFAVSVIARRLEKDPLRYRDYGMYWPALKEVMRKHDFDSGEPVYPMLRELYKGKNDLLTVVSADEFRKFYLATWAVGTNQFVLDSDNPEIFIIVDDAMEQLTG